MLPVSRSRSSAEDWLRCYFVPVRGSLCQQLNFPLLHCSDSHLHISGYDSVLFLIHHEGSGKRSVQARSRCGDRENRVGKMAFLTLDSRTDLFLLRFFEIEDRPNVTTEMWEKFR